MIYQHLYVSNNNNRLQNFSQWICFNQEYHLSLIFCRVAVILLQRSEFTHWPPGGVNNGKCVTFILSWWLAISKVLLWHCLHAGECHRSLLMRSQNWLKQWLGANRQQAIIWANVDWDLCCHMVLLGYVHWVNDMPGQLDWITWFARLNWISNYTPSRETLLKAGQFLDRRKTHSKLVLETISESDLSNFSVIHLHIPWFKTDGVLLKQIELNSLWPSDAILRHRTNSTLAQVI